MTTIADAVWIATGLLHREHPDRTEFSVQEIKDRLNAEGLEGAKRAGVDPHVRQHCVANRPPDPARLRLLYATGTRMRRLYRPGDPFDPGRAGGRTMPSESDVPAKYKQLISWYRNEYGSGAQPQGDPILRLRGLGKEIWDEHPDDYVRRLREGWE
jgi:hypothetical protein